MNIDILLLVGIIAFSIVAFAREWLPMDVVALTCLALLLLCNLVTPEQAISGFSNPAVITVMMMFVLSAALVHSGLVSKLGYKISDISGGSKWKATTLLLILTAMISAFLNNTAAVAVFMPVAIHLARLNKFSPSKILMPLSYTAIFGGTFTLLGTSTNLLVGSLSAQQGAGTLTMFEFAPLGGLFILVGLAYNLLVPMRFMPSRSIDSSLTRKYHLTGFLTELRVPAGSKLIDKNVLSEHVAERFQMNVLEIVRGGQKIFQDIRNTAIAENDILLVRGAMEDILAFRESYGLLLLTDIKLGDEDLSDRQTVLAEVQLSPVATMVGSTLREIDFRRQYGCFVIALNRTGEYIREKLASIPLKQWDTLLVFGSRPRVEALYEQGNFMPLGERELTIHLERRWWIGVSVIVLVVALAAMGVMPILKASILGVVAVLVTRRLTIQQAYRSIDWTVIFLIAAILPMGLAMENTGLAGVIASGIEPFGSRYGPTVLLSTLFISTTLLTNVFSNNATAVLMVPIGVSAARELGVDPKPFLMCIAYAASLAFLTPVGYQTNAMVFGPGSYKFMDFLRFGWPLTLIFWVLATFLIPVMWPL